jgi:hypothetical protein
MNSLSQVSPLNSFKNCQICGYVSSDICDFYIWHEYDENNGKSDNILVACKNKKCLRVIEDHELIYEKVPWGQGGPGKFMLVCGECKLRDNTACTHPDLKENGGEGLKIYLSNSSIGNARVCFTNGTSRMMGQPATECTGFEDKNT